MDQIMVVKKHNPVTNNVWSFINILLKNKINDLLT
jgi:hypothetical protein